MNSLRRITGESPEASRLKAALDEQMQHIARRLPIDIRVSVEDANNGGGFLTYYLNDASGKALSESMLKELRVTEQEIQGIDGFQKISEYCQKHYYRVVFDRYLNFTDGANSNDRFIRITVDGW